MFKEFVLTGPMRENLALQLKRKEEIFTFKSDPLLASLVACLGLQFEIGREGQDRLSAALGIADHQLTGWKSQMIEHNQKIGLRLWIDEAQEFQPRHPDFVHLLHPLSFDKDKRLHQIVFFPTDIARAYEKINFELVIVREWALTAFLMSSEDRSVNYLLTNNWEIENNSARWQGELMTNGQIAFSGTHDMADHLLGANRTSFNQHQSLFREVQKEFKKISLTQSEWTKLQLVTAYLIGVLMDDMAQPRNYKSKTHAIALHQTLHFLKSINPNDPDIPSLKILVSFDRYIHLVRYQQGYFFTHKQPLFESLVQDFKVGEKSNATAM